MPLSPLTPTRRRLSSNMDLSLVSASPQSNGYSSQTNGFSPRNLAHSRRTSLYSIPSPSTTRPVSLHNRHRSSGAVSDYDGATCQGNGLGNLADELAEAWDEDGEGVPEDSGSALRIDGRRISYNEDTTKSEELLLLNQWRSPDVASDPQTPPSISVAPKTLLSPMKHSSRQKNSRNKSQYEEPDHFSESGSEDITSLPSSLETRMAAIESLARWGTETNCNDADSIVSQVAESLKDLGSQSSLESYATRFITANNALATNLTHQTRLLQNLTYPIFSPLPHSPDSVVISSLIPMLSSLTHLTPIPSSQPLTALLHLRSSSADLLSALSGLSDTLHMARQTTTLASRRLNAARKMVSELKKEAELEEEGIRWLEKEHWGDRLAGRECARVCSEVVGGFEEVCRGWRERLVEDGIGATGVEVGAG